MADSTDTSRFAYIRVLDKKHGTQAKLFLNQFGKLFEFNDRTLQGSYIMAKYCAPRACQNLMFTASHLGYQIGFKLGASVRLRLNFFFFYKFLHVPDMSGVGWNSKFKLVESRDGTHNTVEVKLCARVPSVTDQVHRKKFQVCLQSSDTFRTWGS